MTFDELSTHMEAITPHQRKIIQAIYDAGETWLTRSKVARAIDKRRLTPYDIDCLILLTEIGIIEASTQPTTAPGSDFAYIYHMPDDIAALLQEWSALRDTKAQDQHRKPINIVED